LRGDDRFYKDRTEGVQRYSEDGLREGLKDGFVPVVEPVIRKGILTESDCTESPTGRKPGDPYTNVDFSYVTGEIEHVFEASAKRCEELERGSQGRTKRNRRLVKAPRAKQKPAAAQHESVQAHTPGGRSGDATLIDGKQAVALKTAEQYLGIAERQRQHLIKKHALDVIGQGHNRKITTESLRRYRPPENPM